MERPDLTRRQLLAGGAILGAGGLLAACGVGTSSPSGTTPAPGKGEVFTTTIDGVKVRQAQWVIDENNKPGSLGWIIGNKPPPHGLEGYASSTSADRSGFVDLMVSTTEPSFTVKAWRMGYYQGTGGRLIWTSATLPGTQQAPPTVDESVRMVTCHWSPSVRVPLETFPPGSYLFQLVSSSGWQQWIPFVVRDDARPSTYLLMTAVTTYQAYNMWGGFSLYHDEAGSRAHRAVEVSFNRPYAQDFEQGAADFVGNELPLVFDMERRGLDVSYWTDIDLHLSGDRLHHYGSLMSLGHDEYWSLEMRDFAEAALAAGTNIAFLGANAVYRKIRLAQQDGQPARIEINYKDDTDPAGLKNPLDGTSNWGAPPVNLPESLFTGVTYVTDSGVGPLVVVDAAGWWWRGTGVTDGQSFYRAMQGEYNRFIPGGEGPQNVQLFGHSPMNKGEFSDITYLTKDGGGGVFSTGIGNFIALLANPQKIPTAVLPGPNVSLTPILLRAMLNLYGLWGQGPASRSMPSKPNWHGLVT